MNEYILLPYIAKKLDTRAKIFDILSSENDILS